MWHAIGLADDYDEEEGWEGKQKVGLGIGGGMSDTPAVGSGSMRSPHVQGLAPSTLQGRAKWLLGTDEPVRTSTAVPGWSESLYLERGKGGGESETTAETRTRKSLPKRSSAVLSSSVMRSGLGVSRERLGKRQTTNQKEGWLGAADSIIREYVLAEVIFTLH